ncbi:heterokaryon incompatibility protein-domain-containing protein [Podospora didyma]|uniref:Heterokaryon incompatibility protein-domain-containing protein n=1 Tax=Podospora didyma TaxID=330526 RepID=A0AAE0NUR6_9PEZI|nr:heterokaryon incompatibility protein-domain-containing protein [Podospora didyma]
MTAIFPGSRTPWPVIGAANHIEPDGLLPGAIKLAKSWIQECAGRRDDKHASCSQYQEKDSPLPNRVIDVSPSGTNGTDSLRLYLPPAGETGRYVALSHCWGGQTPTMTTTATLSSFVSEIPTPLPQTFADAVAVTRALGIRYLWIDSLCILQDSRDDWAEQAPLMGAIYSGAYVTVSADAADNSTEGFLRHANRKYFQAVRVPYDGAATENSPIWVRQRGALGYQLPFHDFTGREFYSDDATVKHRARYLVRRMLLAATNDTVKDVEDEVLATLSRIQGTGGADPSSKLSTRGWVFQERALAARTLHFGPAEMAWECRSLISCECSASGMRYRRTRSLLKNAINAMDWTDIVEEYSRLEFTVAEDRLVALAGLAEAAAQRRRQRGGENEEGRDGYLAGLWTRDLRTEMLWMSVFRREAIKTYVAPSWSWASVTASIQYPRPAPNLGDWRVVNMHCPPVLAGSVFGNCSPDSYMDIEGPLIHVKLVLAEDPAGGWPSLEWSLLPVGPEEGGIGKARTSIHWDCDDRKQTSLDQQRKGGSFVLFVATQKPENLHGLLLREVYSRLQPGRVGENDPTSMGPGYERVGYVKQPALSQRRTWSDSSSVSESESEDEAPMECWEFWSKFMERGTIRVG